MAGKLSLAAVAVVALLFGAFGGAALAVHTFSEGYADGTFKPGEPVSRQAMSAFMNRLAGADPAVPPMVNASTVRGSTPAQLEPRIWHSARATPIALNTMVSNTAPNIVVVGGSPNPSLPAGTYEVTVSGRLIGGGGPWLVSCQLADGGVVGDMDVLSVPPSISSLVVGGDQTPVSFSGTAVVDLTAPGSIIFRCWRDFGGGPPYPTVAANMVAQAVRDL